MKAIILLSLITFVFSQTLYQRIRYDSFTDYRTSTLGKAYHSFTFSNSLKQISPDKTTDYKMILIRNNLAGITNKVFFNDDVNLGKYEEFFTKIDGVNFSENKYVIWDLTKNCAFNSQDGVASLSFKLIYFKCDTDMQTFYDSLTNTDKAINFGKKFIDANIVLKTNTTFLSKSYLLGVLTGTKTMELESEFCFK